MPQQLQDKTVALQCIASYSLLGVFVMIWFWFGAEFFRSESIAFGLNLLITLCLGTALTCFALLDEELTAGRSNNLRALSAVALAWLFQQVAPGYGWWALAMPLYTAIAASAFGFAGMQLWYSAMADSTTTAKQ